MAAGEERPGPYRGSGGSLALSLLAAWLLVGSQTPVRACGNPFDALMCPTAGCSCGDAPWPGSSGISAWLSYPEPGGPGSGGGPGGCGPCGSGGAAGAGGAASQVPRWQRYWPSWGGGGGGELGWPPVRGEDGPQIHPRPYGRPSLSVTARNQQAVVYDIPLWYAPASGPAVEMRLAYNSWDKRYDDPTPADPPSNHLEMASWPVGGAGPCSIPPRRRSPARATGSTCRASRPWSSSPARRAAASTCRAARSRRATASGLTAPRAC